MHIVNNDSFHFNFLIFPFLGTRFNWRNLVVHLVLVKEKRKIFYE